MPNATTLQLRALHTLWHQYAAHSIESDERAARLAYATEHVGRPVESFKELSSGEASDLIDTLQRALGREPIAPKPHAPRRGERIHDRTLAQAAGTEGRRIQSREVVTIASQEDLDRIDEAITRLGWDRARFDAWLRSPSSPLARRSNPQIRTLYEANRVWWALKALMKKGGCWNQNSGAADFRQAVV